MCEKERMPFSTKNDKKSKVDIDDDDDDEEYLEEEEEEEEVANSEDEDASLYDTSTHTSESLVEDRPTTRSTRAAASVNTKKPNRSTTKKQVVTGRTRSSRNRSLKHLKEDEDDGEEDSPTSMELQDQPRQRKRLSKSSSSSRLKLTKRTRDSVTATTIRVEEEQEIDEDDDDEDTKPTEMIDNNNHNDNDNIASNNDQDIQEQLIEYLTADANEAIQEELQHDTKQIMETSSINGATMISATIQHERRMKTSSSTTTTTTTSIMEKVMATLEAERVAASNNTNEHPLILTGEKRRGVYECDYCSRDVSQFPRIRCAVCVDFDLCLDCFSSSYCNNIQTTKQQQQQHQQHKSHHRYRVADSTRFPLFPSTRSSNISNTNNSSNVLLLPSTTTTSSTVITAKTDTIVQTTATAATNTLVEPEVEPETVEDANNDNNNRQLSEATTTTTVTATTTTIQAPSTTTPATAINADLDIKNMWTVEEDLRLLDGIKTFGLGNWTEIAEAIGSSNKSAKRVMERYFDDYLGRYGHILPPQILLEVDDTTNNNNNNNNDTNDVSNNSSSYMKPTRKSTTSKQQKKVRVCVDTSLLPMYESVWPDPYIPVGATAGQLVNRDVIFKMEQAAAKGTTDVDRIIRSAEFSTNSIPSSIVIPPRLEDIQSLPGSELAGYMPRRGDFDVEWDNDAENILAEMEFSATDSPMERQLKLQVLEIYNEKLDERERRKNFLIERNLLNYQKNQLADKMRPPDERDMIHRMRLFERFHTKEEHEKFLANLLRAKKLRKEIETLQMYRKMGIRTLAEVEKYELDKNRRDELLREAEKKKEMSNFVGLLGNVNTTNATATTDTSTNSDVLSFSEASERKGKTSSQDVLSSSATDEAKNKINENGVVTTVDANKTESAAFDRGTGSSAGDDGNVGATTGRPEELVANNKSSAEDEFEVVGIPGSELLSSKEIMLCKRIRLMPQHYLAVKRALLHESLQNGMLSSEGEAKKSVFQLDVEQRNGVIEFVLKAGWLSAKPNFVT